MLHGIHSAPHVESVLRDAEGSPRRAARRVAELCDLVGRFDDNVPHNDPRGTDVLTTASTITIRETLELLDGPYLSVGEGVSAVSYAFWLGSGISRSRVIGLDGVLAKLIEFVRSHVTPTPDCAYRKALDRIIEKAAPSPEQAAQIDYAMRFWPFIQP